MVSQQEKEKVSETVLGTAGAKATLSGWMLATVTSRSVAVVKVRRPAETAAGRGLGRQPVGAK